MSKSIINFIKILVTLLVLSLILRQLDWSSVWETLTSISTTAIFGAFAVLLVQCLLTSERLLIVVKRIGGRCRRRDALVITLEGMFFSQTFISFLGGDAVRIWRLQRLDMPLGDATAAVALDRLIGITVNHLFLLASLPWLLTSITDRVVQIVIVLLALAGVGGVGLILLLGALRGRGGYLHRLRTVIPIRSLELLLVESATVGRYFLSEFPRVKRLIVISLLIAASNMLVFLIVLTGMGVDTGLAARCALLVPAVLEIAMMPVSIAGWGLREGAAVLTFTSIGLDGHEALSASLAYGLGSAAVSLLGGIIWISRRQKNKGVTPDARPSGRTGGARVFASRPVSERSAPIEKTPFACRAAAPSSRHRALPGLT